MISVEFHNTVDDSLPKFAVIPVQIPGKCCSASTGSGYLRVSRRPQGSREKIEHTARRELYERDRCSGLHPDAVKRIFGP